MKEKSEIRRIAIQLLIDMQVNKLPIDPFAIAKKKNIPVIIANTNMKKIMNEYSIDAVCYRHENKITIFYNDDVKPFARIRFSIAHEIGHVILNHLHVNDVAPRMNSRHSDNPEEWEADTFAIELLAPKGIIFELGLQKHPGGIKDIFDISYTSAKIRSDSLKSYMFGKKANKLEMQLYNQIENI